MTMTLGLMQGRLSRPTDGHIQEFPRDWQKEFESLKECGLAGVEWLITQNTRKINPLLETPQLVSKYPVLSVCADTLVDERIVDKSYLNDNLVKLCNTLMQFTVIRNITIPLLEESSMDNPVARGKFCELIKDIGDKYPEICFSFEAELGMHELRQIVSLCGNFYVTYDTGNITSYGLDHAEYIKFFGMDINNVHLKDRTFAGQTVAPLSGDTDFRTIFKTLVELNYNGPYILQTARELEGEERETILNHKKIFESLYEEFI